MKKQYEISKYYVNNVLIKYQTQFIVLFLNNNISFEKMNLI